MTAVCSLACDNLYFYKVKDNFSINEKLKLQYYLINVLAQIFFTEEQ